ncbi:MAG: phosphate regulon transcriptional regulator PhoB [Methylococcaceae bacterium]|nr:phosphate regulon transcriptional regulator PhoB [Methylococcaceae bacterium]
MITILVVEDDTPILNMLRDLLEAESNIHVLTALNITQAQALVGQSCPDLILLDWMLPDMSGAEWVRRLRQDDLYVRVPIIMLTAKGEEEDKVRALDMGADDYITKPFSSKELIARIKAVLRRRINATGSGRLVLAGIELLLDEHRVLVEGRDVSLSPMEYRLLEFFMSHPEKVYTRSQLLDNVWGRSVFIEERTVDVHIRRLRKTLANFGREDAVQTIRGFGYRFSERTGAYSADPSRS